MTVPHNCISCTLQTTQWLTCERACTGMSGISCQRTSGQTTRPPRPHGAPLCDGLDFSTLLYYYSTRTPLNPPIPSPLSLPSLLSLPSHSLVAPSFPPSQPTPLLHYSTPAARRFVHQRLERDHRNDRRAVSEGHRHAAPRLAPTAATGLKGGTRKRQRRDREETEDRQETKKRQGRDK